MATDDTGQKFYDNPAFQSEANNSLAGDLGEAEEGNATPREDKHTLVRTI